MIEWAKVEKKSEKKREKKLYIPCIEIFLTLWWEPVFLEKPLFKIFAITEAYFGASDNDLTTE